MSSRWGAAAWVVVLLAWAAAPRSASAREEPPPTAPPEAEGDPASAGGAVPPARTLVRAFGDIGWRSEHDGEPGSFALGQFDVFLTSQLASDLSVLGEVVLEDPEDDRSQIAEVERFQLQYSPSDLLRVSVGRMHTMLGFWNQAYHHGSWLQTTAFRPEVYRWEDEGGGMLPVHEVGVRLAGRAVVSPARIEYAASVVNGRASRPSQVTTLQDENGAKGVNVWLGLTPLALPNLQFGATAVFDLIPPAPGTPGREAPLDERIWGGFVAFQGSRLEALVEAFDVRHRDSTAGAEWRSTGLYAQVAWAAGPLKPYYRFDHVDRDEDDPYYEPGVRDLTMHTAGLRLDAWARAALKLEASRSEVPGRSPYLSVAAQAAFTF